ncbi:hypothetical protein [Microvirga tunisiensis]|uniref:hypothetical protein n=1 Tax=Microvirga tunisiensis TaxID=2108360 RepID=UPI00129CAA9F|nr:hypothetical protein [Microvirga tunisiensis]
MTVSVLNEHGSVRKGHSIEGCRIGDWIKALAEVGTSLPGAGTRSALKHTAT